jgi:16S rRNA processing protein RimM
LKLQGLDDPTAAERLRGGAVSVAIEDAPELDDGEHYVDLLAGLDVVDEQGRALGVVAGVQPTGGADLLQVRRPGTQGDDALLLVPMAREIVLEIDEEQRRITVRLPPGLEELNR